MNPFAEKTDFLDNLCEAEFGLETQPILTLFAASLH